MTKDNYNKIFVYPNGDEFKVLDSYMGKYLAIPIQKIYKNKEYQNKNQYMADTWKKMMKQHKEKFFEKEKNLINIKDDRMCSVIITYVITECKNWKEYLIVNYYNGEHYSNVVNYTKIEVILMAEEYSRRLFVDWRGNTNLFDVMEDIGERLWEELSEGKEYDNEQVIRLEFYTSKGENEYLEFERPSELENLVASIRVVEFEEDMCEEV